MEAYEHLAPTGRERQAAAASSRPTSAGIEKKPLPYLLGMMNLLLHGIQRPAIVRQNALATPVTQIPQARPRGRGPHQPAVRRRGGEGDPEQLPRRDADGRDRAGCSCSSSSAGSKEGGRCGIVVPNGVLFADGVGARIKEQLLSECNLHTIVRLPDGRLRPLHRHPDEPPVLREDGPHEGGLVLRAAAARRPAQVHQDQPAAVRGVRRLPGVVGRRRPQGPGGDRPRLARPDRRHRGEQLQPRPVEPAHGPTT